MQYRSFKAAGKTVSINYPDVLEDYADILFPDARHEQAENAAIQFSVRQDKKGKFEIFENDKLLSMDLNAGQCALEMMNETVRSIAEHCQDYLALHAAAVCNGDLAVVMPANSGAGKTTLAAWLVSQDYQYLTDELVIFHPDSLELDAVYRPLNIKTSGIEAINSLTDCTEEIQRIITDSVVIWPAESVGKKALNANKIKPGLFIFPSYVSEHDLQIESLSSAQVGLELMACNVNARNLQDHGFKQVTQLARQVPGFRLTYSDFMQLDDFLPKLIELFASHSFDYKFLKSILRAGVNRKVQTKRKAARAVPLATPIGERKKLCIAMATYDDYDGVYFSTQAIRLYHPEIVDDTEIMVIDNHPTGQCSEELKALDSKIKNYRYLPVMEKTGTSIRDEIFKNANASYVLCMDCHVFIEPGALIKLLDYFDSNPHSPDLLQGPMYSDDLVSLSTHFNPVWNKGMYGVWGFDERGRDIDAPPFEIPMQGLGLFACRKESWPGFNPKFRGFGGEEGYIHEKFRRQGGQTLCLPFLRWMHRFARPQGVPYPINWADRIRNYMIGFSELGLDTDQIIDHFNDHLDASATSQIVKEIEAELN